MDSHPRYHNERSPTRVDSVRVLSSFLRGEISAVETYKQAIQKLENFAAIAQLRDCMSSHQKRAQLLSDQIRRLGGEPDTSSGTWGAFARLVEGGAKLFGEKAAIAALEQGEDHGRDDYKRDIDLLEPESRLFVEAQIFPEQLRTHDVLSRLKKSSLLS